MTHDEDAAYVQSVDHFLTEHHEYLVRATMVQVAGLRQQMKDSHDGELRAVAAEVAQEKAANADELSGLRSQLALAHHSLDRLVGKQDGANWMTAVRFMNGKGALSKQTIFFRWMRLASSQKAERLLIHCASKFCARSAKARFLSGWARFVHGSRGERDAAAAKERLHGVTSEIVHRYEAELTRMRAQIAALQTEVGNGHRRRKILEDELRRTLLKGMVTMNMEALSIFSSAAATDAAVSQAVGLRLSSSFDHDPVPRQGPPTQSQFAPSFDHR
ncbi:hypothetical protein M885DRAFT_626520 [Pelagophyceae sp. CCMP2097]|nr:hypothetical protein M885DRAFT_626520 [Pelagophyceae sp. CCMP2097]